MGYPTIIASHGIYYLISHSIGYPIKIPHHPTSGRYLKVISHTVPWDGREANIPHHPVPFRPLLSPTGSVSYITGFASFAIIHAVVLMISGRNTCLVLILKRSLICLELNLKRSTAKSGL